MKKIALILLVSSFAYACTSNGESSNTKEVTTATIEHGDGVTAEPKFEFEHDVWDFGTVKEGDIVEHTFKFKNVGDADLVIADVTSSCGCTAPHWTNKPVRPGEEGKIKVEFNSNGKSDQVVKDVKILANTVPVKTQLRIKVFVEKAN